SSYAAGLRQLRDILGGLSSYAAKTAVLRCRLPFPRPSGLRDLCALLCGSLFVRWPENFLQRRSQRSRGFGIQRIGASMSNRCFDKGFLPHLSYDPDRSLISRQFVLRCTTPVFLRDRLERINQLWESLRLHKGLSRYIVSFKTGFANRSY